MNIGEFFIKLGVKGDDQAKKSVEGLTSKISDVRSMSLEAKAAIVGVFYALQRMMQSSGNLGSSLSNFSALTGQSAEMLQRYQYAAMKVGISNGEVEGSFKSLQKIMHDTAIGKGLPEGAGRFAQLVPDFDESKLEDTLYVMQKLQEYAQKENVISERMRVLGSFGISEGMQSAMAQNAFDPKILQQAEIYSNSQLKALQKMDAMWNEINRKIQMSFGKFFAGKEGQQIIKDIKEIVNEVLKLSLSLLDLAKKLEVFKALADIMSFFGESIKKANEVTDVAKSIPKNEKERAEKNAKLIDYGKDFIKYMAENMTASRVTRDFQLDIAKQAVPNMKREPQSVPEKVVTNNNNVVFNHNGTNSGETVDAFNKRVNETFRQMSAQVQGN